MINTTDREVKDSKLLLAMPASMRARLDHHARQLDRPAAWVARQAITEWLDRNEPHQDGA